MLGWPSAPMPLGSRTSAAPEDVPSASTAWKAATADATPSPGFAASAAYIQAAVQSRVITPYWVQAKSYCLSPQLPEVFRDCAMHVTAVFNCQDLTCTSGGGSARRMACPLTNAPQPLATQCRPSPVACGLSTQLMQHACVLQNPCLTCTSGGGSARRMACPPTKAPEPRATPCSLQAASCCLSCALRATQTEFRLKC